MYISTKAVLALAVVGGKAAALGAAQPRSAAADAAPAARAAAGQPGVNLESTPAYFRKRDPRRAATLDTPLLDWGLRDRLTKPQPPRRLCETRGQSCLGRRSVPVEEAPTPAPARPETHAPDKKRRFPKSGGGSTPGGRSVKRHVNEEEADESADLLDEEADESAALEARAAPLPGRPRRKPKPGVHYNVTPAGPPRVHDDIPITPVVPSVISKRDTNEEADKAAADEEADESAALEARAAPAPRGKPRQNPRKAIKVHIGYSGNDDLWRKNEKRTIGGSSS